MNYPKHYERRTPRTAFPCNNCGDPTPPDVFQKNDGECDDCHAALDQLEGIQLAQVKYQLALAAGLQATFALKRDSGDPGALFVLAYASAVADQAEKEAQG